MTDRRRFVERQGPSAAGEATGPEGAAKGGSRILPGEFFVL